MADNITLKTYKGGNVTPQDDAIIYETAIPGSGIFKGCEVTYARGNVLHISQGFGMIRGRFFEVYETEVDVRLADVGETLQGRVYIHLDLSNADEPIKILAQAAAELPPLDADVNINYNNSSYDLELAIFTVSSAGLDGLTKVFPTLKAGSGGGGGGGETLTRATSYAVGDAVTAVGAPGWATLVCTQAGTTAASEPSGYSRITKVGDKVLDGTAVFTARNIIGELDGVISSNASLGESVQTLDEKVAEMMSSTGLVIDDMKYRYSFYGKDTISATKELYEFLNDKVPYLISMISSDLSKLVLDDIKDTSVKEQIQIPDPVNEPVIGVIDTLFAEQVYFHNWVENVDYLDEYEKVGVSSDQRKHGTEVTSILVDGPRLNPWLNDGCGRFRVKR